MQRRFALPLIFLGPLAQSGCGFVVMHTARKIYQENTRDESAIELALAHYSEAVLRSDAERAATFFSDEAQFSQGDDAPVLGRPAIQAFFMKPNGQRLTEYELNATSTHVDGSLARQTGSFHRRFVSPLGAIDDAKGSFEAQWARQAGGSWLLTRLHTAAAV
jgi:ketosteroid isomerase-like protein